MFIGNGWPQRPAKINIGYGWPQRPAKINIGHGWSQRPAKINRSITLKNRKSGKV